jgi:hypothetical protein
MRLSRVRTVAVHLIVCSLSPTANADDPTRSPVTLTAQQDRQLMLDHLKIPAETMRRGPSGMNPNAPDYQNTDETKANPWPNLPEMMITKGRRPVDTPELWWKVRRPEIVEYFDVEVYGRIPNEVPMVTWEADSDIAGGGGGYHRYAALTATTLVAYCDPYWGWCYPATGQAVTNSDSLTKWGWSAAAGITFNLGQGQLYLEARYHWMETSPTTQYFPILLGYRF